MTKPPTETPCDAETVERAAEAMCRGKKSNPFGDDEPDEDTDHLAGRPVKHPRGRGVNEIDNEPAIERAWERWWSEFCNTTDKDDGSVFDIGDVQLAFSRGYQFDRKPDEGALVEALREARKTLTEVNTKSSLDMSQEINQEVRFLGQRIGYGALMNIASSLWKIHLEARGNSGGEFVCGTTRASINNAVDKITAALTAHDNGDE